MLNESEKLDKLDELTVETHLLFCVLDDALNFHADEPGFIEVCSLSKIIRKKFEEISALF